MASRLHALASSFGAPPRSVPQRFAASFEAAAPEPPPPPPPEVRSAVHAALDWDLPPGTGAPEPVAVASSFRTHLDRTVSLSALPDGDQAETSDRHHEDGQRPDPPAETQAAAPVLEGVVLPPERKEMQPQARAASLDDEAFERTFAALMSEAQQSAGPQQAAPPAAAPPQPPPDDDPHEIFNRMGRSMQFANTFNLGRIDIDRHFDALERSLALESGPPKEPAVFALSDAELADDIHMTSAPAAAAPDRAAFVQSPASGGPDSRAIAVAPTAAIDVQPQQALQSDELQTPEVSAAAVSAPDPNPTHEMEPVAPV